MLHWCASQSGPCELQSGSELQIFFFLIVAEIEVITEMHTSRALRARYGGNCHVALRGRFLLLDPQLTSSSPILTFVAFCTLVAHLPEDGENTSKQLSFQSLHTLDMKIAEVTERLETLAA